MLLRRPPEPSRAAALPFPVLPAPPRHRVLGLLLSLAGRVLLFLAFFLLAALLAFAVLIPVGLFVEPAMAAGMLAAVPVAALGAACVPRAADLVRYGRKLRALDALTLLAKDPRPPVLFLRSFGDEDLHDLTFRGGTFSPFIPQRFEESIARVLGRLGPVISIGIPGEGRGELGAARLYVSDDHWQAAVTHFLGRAAAVVVVVGRTPSLWWEVDAALAAVPRQRLLFFFPPADDPQARRSFWRRLFRVVPSVVPKAAQQRMEAERQARWDLFREATRAHLGDDLPPQPGEALFLDFAERRRPRLLATRRPFMALFYFYMPRSVSTWISMRRTLRPFVRKVARLEG